MIGSSSIVFKLHSLPSGGQCSIDQKSGIALSTYFVISCTGWTDSDGIITRYEYYGLKLK